MEKKIKNETEIDLRKSYEYFSREKIKDFYGCINVETTPFTEWLMKENFRDILLMKELYDMLPDGDYDETLIRAKKKIFITIKKKDKL